jgi:putative ABC transport system permease protein
VNSWALAWRNLVRQKRRTFLMGSVVAFGFAAFALAGGFIAQSFEGLKEGTIRSVGHLQIVDRRAVDRSEETTLEFGLKNAGRARAIAARDPDVDAVLPRIEFVGLATNGAKSVPYLGLGVDPDPEQSASLAGELVVAGRYLSDADGGDVVLGTGLASALGAKTGDIITLLATTPDGSLNAVDGLVSGFVDVRIKTVSKLVVFVKKGVDENRVAPRLQRALVAAGFPVAVRKWEDLAVFYGQVKLLYIGIFGFVGAVLVVIVILSAAIVMTMAATERTREIGTLRAIGTRPAGIQKMFLAEGAALAIAGCVAGAAIALVVRAILNASGIILPPPPGATHGLPINVRLYPLAYAAGFVTMIATMVVASWFPARRASRMPIVDALTHV